MQRRVKYGILLLLCSVLSCNSNDSDNSLSPLPSCLLPGSYEYLKTTTLQAPYDPVCGANFTLAANGELFRVDSGRTTLLTDGSKFLMQVGEEGRWKMKITCTSQETASIEITLSNKCASSHETTAAATARTIIRQGVSSLYIDPYFIEWTCGDAVSCMVTERWELHQSRQ